MKINETAMVTSRETANCCRAVDVADRSDAGLAIGWLLCTRDLAEVTRLDALALMLGSYDAHHLQPVVDEARTTIVGLISLMRKGVIGSSLIASSIPSIIRHLEIDVDNVVEAIYFSKGLDFYISSTPRSPNAIMDPSPISMATRWQMWGPIICLMSAVVVITGSVSIALWMLHRM